MSNYSKLHIFDYYKYIRWVLLLHLFVDEETETQKQTESLRVQKFLILFQSLQFCICCFHWMEYFFVPFPKELLPFLNNRTDYYLFSSTILPR